jgi:hypothetical protein
VLGRVFQSLDSLQNPLELVLGADQLTRASSLANPSPATSCSMAAASPSMAPGIFLRPASCLSLDFGGEG